MWFQGETTNELYEEFMKKGFCEVHQKDLEIEDTESYEVQRKALLYLQMLLFNPLILDKPFASEKIKTLFEKHALELKIHPSEKESEQDARTLENILYLDAIVVFTICHFSKICCVGALFQQNKLDCVIQSKEKNLINLLLKKEIEQCDIGYLIPQLRKNFYGVKEEVYKFGYVATMLLVRNVSLSIKLKDAIAQLDKELKNIPTECKSWWDIASDARTKEQYDDAIEACNSGLKFNAYHMNLLQLRGEMYYSTKKYKNAALDCFIIMIVHSKSTPIVVLCQYATALFKLTFFEDCIRIVKYALQNCAKEDPNLAYLIHLKKAAEKTQEHFETVCKDKTAITVFANEMLKVKPDNNNLHEVKRKAAVWPKLSANAINRILNGENVHAPIVQILDQQLGAKTEADPYKLLISDGITKTSALMVSQLVQLVISKKLEKFTIVRVDSYVYHSNRKKMLILQELTILFPGNEVCEKLGNPIYAEDTKNDATTVTAQPKLVKVSSNNNQKSSNRSPVSVINERPPSVHPNNAKDIPELIEASDSESDEDVPDLMEASNSDSSSDSEEIAEHKDKVQVNKKEDSASFSTSPSKDNSKDQNQTLENLLVKALNSNATLLTKRVCRRRHQIKNFERYFYEDEDEDSQEAEDSKSADCSVNKNNQMQCLLKEASQKLIANDASSAGRMFREALDELKAFPEEYKYKDKDIVCIKYAFGTSNYKSREYDDLQKAITTFKGITEDHSDVVFPAAYYGIAISNYKLNRFKESLHYLQIVDDLLQNGTTIETYSWPETSSVIEETKPENLKNLVTDLVSECENPPAPDATCRFQDCSLQPAIYYTDPDFKGFFAIQCSSQCTLQFHPQCWKLLKNEKHLSDKEFLDQNCITPDCDGAIIKIENTDKDGEITKAFESTDSKKSSRKKSRFEKKLEVKEGKRRKRRDSSSRGEAVSESTGQNESSKETSKENSPAVEIHSNKSDAKAEVKQKVDPPNASEAPVYPETFTIIKKEKFVEENAGKITSKSKEHKKSKNTVSIDEFLDNDAYGSSNDYQQRLNALKQDKEKTPKKQKPNALKATAPSFEPQILSFAQAATLDDFPLMPSTSKPDSAASIESTSPPSSNASFLPQDFSVELAKRNIYSYLKNILCKYGPLPEDDEILVKELQSFPGEANALIADSGGLGKFLQQSMEFAFVGDMYVCTSDQIPRAYQKMNKAGISMISNPYSDCGDYYLNPDAEEYNPNQLSDKFEKTVSQYKNGLGGDVKMGSYSSFEQVKKQAGDSEKSPTKQQLAQKCLEAIEVYLSADEHRSYIGQMIQPYAIVEVSKKSNAFVQTESGEAEKTNAMKNDELQRLKEVVNFLTEENVSLKGQNELLKEQCSSALDNVTKCQNKSSVELLSLRKELEDVNLELEEQKKLSKTKETKLEKEIKNLSENIKKYKEEDSTKKLEKDTLQLSNKKLEFSLTQAEERINLLLNEKHIIKTTYDCQMDKLRDRAVQLELAHKNDVKRAEDAERKLLFVQKVEFLKRIDDKSKEAVKRMQEMQTGISVANLNPIFKKNFEALLSQIESYIAKLGTIRIDFSHAIDGQIKAIQNGTPLAELKSIPVKELPDIPSWKNQITMQNGPMTNLSQSSMLAQIPMQMTNQNQAYQFPPVNFAQNVATIQQNLLYPPNTSSFSNGAIPKNASSVAIPSSQNSKKLPPGLSNPQLAVSNTPNSTHEVVTTLPPTQSPPVMHQYAGLPQREKVQVASTKAVTGSLKSVNTGTVPTASQVSKSQLDVKKASEISASLELDYNVRKSSVSKSAKVHELSSGSSSKSLSQKPNSWEKLVQKLKAIYPECTQAQATALIKDYKSQNKSMSGQTIETITKGIVAMVNAKREESRRSEAINNRMLTSKPLVNKKLVLDHATAHSELNRNPKKSAWGVSEDSSRQWDGKDTDKSCIICFEEMTQNSAYKVDCGHTFHLDCIKEWMSKKSDCPICRSLILLPEDYPAL